MIFFQRTDWDRQEVRGNFRRKLFWPTRTIPFEGLSLTDDMRWWLPYNLTESGFLVNMKHLIHPYIMLFSITFFSFSSIYSLPSLPIQTQHTTTFYYSLINTLLTSMRIKVHEGNKLFRNSPDNKYLQSTRNEWIGNAFILQ